jgi:hypothetical protein
MPSIMPTRYLGPTVANCQRCRTQGFNSVPTVPVAKCNSTQLLNGYLHSALSDLPLGYRYIQQAFGSSNSGRNNQPVLSPPSPQIPSSGAPQRYTHLRISCASHWSTGLVNTTPRGKGRQPSATAGLHLVRMTMAKYTLT